MFGDADEDKENKKTMKLKEKKLREERAEVLDALKKVQDTQLKIMIAKEDTKTATATATTTDDDDTMLAQACGGMSYEACKMWLREQREDLFKLSFKMASVIVFAALKRKMIAKNKSKAARRNDLQTVSNKILTILCSNDVADTMGETYRMMTSAQAYREVLEDHADESKKVREQTAINDQVKLRAYFSSMPHDDDEDESEEEVAEEEDEHEDDDEDEQEGEDEPEVEKIVKERQRKGDSAKTVPIDYGSVTFKASGDQLSSPKNEEVQPLQQRAAKPARSRSRRGSAPNTKPAATGQEQLAGAEAGATFVRESLLRESLLTVGARCLALWPDANGKDSYPATVASVEGDVITVDWDDKDEHHRQVTADMLQPLTCASDVKGGATASKRG